MLYLYLYLCRVLCHELLLMRVGKSAPVPGSHGYKLFVLNLYSLPLSLSLHLPHGHSEGFACGLAHLAGGF